MSKVFITHEQKKFDYAPANVFGEIITVSERAYSFTPGNAVNEHTTNAINAASLIFDPSNDYVLPSGSAIITALFFVRLAVAGKSKIRMLMWNHNDNAYNIGTVDLTPFTGLK